MAGSQGLRVRKRYRWMTRAAPITSFLPISISRWLQLSGSDKQLAGQHQYGPTYHRLLRPFKWHRCTLLEIGIGGYDVHAGGESLAAWRSFLPLAHIIGCDIIDKRVLAGRGVAIRVLDQSDGKRLVEFGEQNGPFDVSDRRRIAYQRPPDPHVSHVVALCARRWRVRGGGCADVLLAVHGWRRRWQPGCDHVRGMVCASRSLCERRRISRGRRH